MQSKRSSFNLALFRKNLSRSWPLWGGLSILGALFPLYMLLSMLNSPRTTPYAAQEFDYLLFNAVTILGPALAMGYAILCAMLVWSYLDVPRAVGFMHTLPVHRDSLFLTNVLSGMAMILIPYVVVGAGFCIVTLCWGALPVFAVLETAALVILMNLLFFGMATFCAMVTGSIFAMPVLYVVVNFLAPLMSLLTDVLASTYLVGIQGRDPLPASIAFAPVIQIYDSFEYRYVGQLEGHGVYQLEGVWVVCVYGLVGIALLGLSWLLYRARRSESAGDVVAFRWLRPVFRFGLALLSAVTLGWLLYALLWGSLFQSGGYTEPIPMAICMVLTGLVGYYAATMLLEKSLRVFKNTWKGALVVCAGAVALNAALYFDLAGRETWVPDAGDVQQLAFWGLDVDVTCVAGQDDRAIERVVALHRDLVDDCGAIRDTQDALRRGTEGIHDWANVNILYTLKNGRQVQRNYQLICPEDWQASPMAYDDLLVEFSRDIDVQLQRVSTPYGMELDRVYVGSPNGEGGELEAWESRQVYDALLRDARAGALPGWEPFINDAEGYYDYDLEMSFRELPQRDWTGYKETTYMDSEGYLYSRGSSSYKNIRLAPSMTETMDALADLGALPREELDRWAETYGTPDREKFPETVG